MSYKRIPELPFPWGYEELLSLPLYMINHIYRTLDDFLEEDKQKYKNMSSGLG